MGSLRSLYTNSSKSKMNLYIWKDIGFLSGRDPGMAFALAETKERAIDLIMLHYDPDCKEDDYQNTWLRGILNSREPEVIEGEYGHVELSCY